MTTERRDLLLGVIALQMGFISQEQFVEVMTLLPGKREKTAESLFSEKGYLGGNELEALRALLAAHLRRHGGDVEKSIAMLGHDPLVERSMVLVGARPDAGSAIYETTSQTVVLYRKDEDRYVLGRELGRGGIGKVVIAIDRQLMDREVAMKLLLPARLDVGEGGSPSSPPLSERFLEEAHITAQLSHPNIVAVHELGTRPTGEIYYTTPVVSGRTLKEAIRQAHEKLASGEISGSAWGMERLHLLQSFLSLCHAIAYAHSRKVIHRDLKPANVMVGDFGETIVIDWGLAKVMGGAAPHGGGADHQLDKIIRTLREQGGTKTVEGTVTGTPAYMAPEQARGAIGEIDERTDIYALGAVLYEILTGRPPYEGQDALQIVARVLSFEPSPDPRAASVTVPSDLAEIVVKAMCKDKHERHSSARELLLEVSAAIEGGKERERRHREAERLVALGKERAHDYTEMRKEYRRLLFEVKELSGKYKGPVPVSEKGPLYALEEEKKVAGQTVLRLLAESEWAHHQALEQEAGYPGAREGLADLYMSQFLTAEEERDEADFQYYGDLVRSYHDGKYARELEGDGSISLATEPEGAEVYLYRYVERERRLWPVPFTGTADTEALVSRAPIEKLSVPMGSYLAILRKDGYRDVRFPIAVGRNEDVARKVRLYTDAEIGAGFVYVPGGPFISGADPDLRVEKRIREVGDFFMARYPVTCAEYLLFLNDLGSRDPDAARKHAPRWQDVGGMHWIEEPPGVWRLPEGKDAYNLYWALDQPVVEVSFYDAAAYCEWRSGKGGRKVELPSEWEREKAARGVDGRYYPWGDHFEPSFCNMAESRGEGGSRVGPVGEFPASESVYGIGDMAGNVWDWCEESWPGHAEWRVLRGGSWYNDASNCRSALRYAIVASNPNNVTGFRLVARPRQDPA